MTDDTAVTNPANLPVKKKWLAASMAAFLTFCGVLAAFVDFVNNSADVADRAKPFFQSRRQEHDDVKAGGAKAQLTGVSPTGQPELRASTPPKTDSEKPLNPDSAITKVVPPEEPVHLEGVEANHTPEPAIDLDSLADGSNWYRTPGNSCENSATFLRIEKGIAYVSPWRGTPAKFPVLITRDHITSIDSHVKFNFDSKHFAFEGGDYYRCAQ